MREWWISNALQPLIGNVLPDTYFQNTYSLIQTMFRRHEKHLKPLTKPRAVPVQPEKTPVS